MFFLFKFAILKHSSNEQPALYSDCIHDSSNPVLLLSDNGFLSKAHSGKANTHTALFGMFFSLTRKSYIPEPRPAEVKTCFSISFSAKPRLILDTFVNHPIQKQHLQHKCLLFWFCHESPHRCTTKGRKTKLLQFLSLLKT